MIFQNNLIAVAQQVVVEGNSSVFENGTIASLELEYPLITSYSYPEKNCTTIIKDNKFNFKIKATTPELYRLTVKRKNGEKNSTSLFMEPGEYQMNIEDSELDKVSIIGSKVALEYNEFCNQISSVKEDEDFSNYVNIALKEGKINDSKVRFTLDSLYAQRKKAWAEVAIKWIKWNRESLINAYVMHTYLYGNHDENELKFLCVSFNNTLLQSSWGKELIYNLKNLSIGCKVPVFTLQDTSGKNVMLSNYKGKYVLIDFWASWCAPCLKEVPILTKAYKQYKNKSFEIISISLDDNRASWTNAINKENLAWVHLSDLKGRENKVARQYKINSIPMNYLIDKNAVIIAKDVHGSELQNMLHELLGE